ncbi:MAG TPA: PQQ-dependent sugar dehydrogenase [Candidatus Polarisedimenticolaceae bacterium]|nr:PQQ-dependent sugar dehydrogenase [Candidatus Polarisedimenticolaceae bacterium]
MNKFFVSIGAGLATILAAGPAPAQTVTDPSVNLEVESVVEGLFLPTSMAFVGDEEILVLQKNDGLVRHVVGGVLQPGSVLDVDVHVQSERGLLGIATDPDFIHTPYVYLYFTESSTGGDTNDGNSIPLGNRVYRYSWNGSGLVDPLLVLDLPATPGPNHDGGIVVFGPDDALYAVIGDLNRNGKLQNYPAGPEPDDSGVILRVHRSGATLTDGPFRDAGDPGNPLNRYWAYGVRNSFGMAFDPVTGELWNTENGPASYDEVNRVPPGFNSGWERIMGPDARDADDQDDLWVAPGSAYRDPEFSWASTVAPAAIAFVASRQLGCELEHDVIVGDDNCQQLYRFEPNAARDGLVFASPELADRVADNGLLRCSSEQSEVLFGSSWGTVTDIENGPDGYLYIVSLTQGRILRLVPDHGTFDDADSDGVEDACDCAAGDSTAFAEPGEVPRIRLGAATPTTLGWDPQTATAGKGTTYQVVSGDLDSLRAAGGFAGACELAAGLATPALGDPRADPAPGTGVYYLTRAGNACDAGTFGDGSAPADPRDLLDAGTPPACP